MSTCVWGPILDNDLLNIDDIKSIMNRKSDFYPYDVKAVFDNEKSELPLYYVIEIALAGITKNEISVQLTNEGGLSIEVDPVQDNDPNTRILRKNISYAKRMITFDLTKDVDTGRITSKLENGLLKITIPMIKQKSKVKSIVIN